MSKEPLYVSRKIINSQEIIQWYNDQGIQGLDDTTELHITQVYSSNPVDMNTMTYDTQTIKVEKEKSEAKMECFGNGKFLVLALNIPEMQERFKYFQSQGCSFDFPQYNPHTTISNNYGYSPELDHIIPFNGDIFLGPEIAESLELEKVERYIIKNSSSNVHHLVTHENAKHHEEWMLEDINLSFITEYTKDEETYYIKNNKSLTPITDSQYFNFLEKYGSLLTEKSFILLELPANKITLEYKDNSCTRIILETATPGSLHEYIPEIKNQDITLENKQEGLTLS